MLSKKLFHIGDKVKELFNLNVVSNQNRHNLSLKDYIVYRSKEFLKQFNDGVIPEEFVDLNNYPSCAGCHEPIFEGSHEKEYKGKVRLGHENSFYCSVECDPEQSVVLLSYENALRHHRSGDGVIHWSLHGD